MNVKTQESKNIKTNRLTKHPSIKVSNSRKGSKAKKSKKK